MKISGKASWIKYRRIVIFLICFGIVCAAMYFSLTSCNSNTEVDLSVDVATRAKWAKRLDLPGLQNFHKVSDELYRGAQPNTEGMKQLEKLGIKTVVNLRSSHSDRDELEGTGLAYEHIKMTTLNIQSKDAARFLQIVTDSGSTPVFVHCQYGSDRTGTMCAIYRIAVQGWNKDEAIEEMTKGGFGFHSLWKNLVDYIRNLDIDEIKSLTDTKNQ
jgi:protein tyrosine/serine phosphatase